MSDSPKTLIRVASKAPTFRRAGIEFTRDGADIDTATLTAEQLDAIRNEPHLVVSEIHPASESGASVAGSKDAAGASRAPKKTPAGNAKQPGAAKGKVK